MEYVLIRQSLFVRIICSDELRVAFNIASHWSVLICPSLLVRINCSDELSMWRINRSDELRVLFNIA